MWRSRGVAALAAASLLIGVGMQDAQATGRTVTKRTLAPGVVYETITDTSYPLREYVLLYDGSAATGHHRPGAVGAADRHLPEDERDVGERGGDRGRER